MPAQRPRLRGEQRAVGCQRDIADAVDLGDHRHENLDLAPQQRLTARQADLFDAE